MITKANNLIKQMISTLARLENQTQIVSDTDIQILQECNLNLEHFLDKQLYNEEENL